MSYSTVTDSHLRVAVIDKQDWNSDSLGRLTVTQVALLEGELTKRLDLALAGEGTGEPPIFRSWKHSQGILRIHCENDGSLTWLRTCITSLPPLWEGSMLELIPEGQLPRLTKVTLWIPDKTEDTDVVLGRLKRQNPWAKVCDWVVFHTADREEPKGKILVFGVREQTKNKLIERQGRVNYLFTSLKVKIHGSAAEVRREVESPAPMETGQIQTPEVAPESSEVASASNSG